MSGVKMLNIDGSTDAHYRHKMPALITKIEGSGNGIKTVIPNMADVAKALRIQPAYCTKFFGISLGAQSKWTEAKQRSVVNGAHTTKDMQEVLQAFITAYVLCPTDCRAPELDRKVKSKMVTYRCKACGARGNLKGKINTYIIKTETGAKKGGKKDKKDKKDKKKSKSEEKESKTEKKEKTEEKREWATDTSKEAQAARQAEHLVAKKVNTAVEQILADAAEAGESTPSPSTLLRVFLASTENPTVTQIYSEAARLQYAHELKQEAVIKLVLDVVIDTEDVKNVHKQFAQKASLFKRYTTTEEGQLEFLKAVEELVGGTQPLFMSRIGMILNELVTTETVSEEVSPHPGPPEHRRSRMHLWFSPSLLGSIPAGLTRRKCRLLCVTRPSATSTLFVPSPSPTRTPAMTTRNKPVIHRSFTHDSAFDHEYTVLHW
jgi:translation initiation factor 5